MRAESVHARTILLQQWSTRLWKCLKVQVKIKILKKHPWILLKFSRNANHWLHQLELDQNHWIGFHLKISKSSPPHEQLQYLSVGFKCLVVFLKPCFYSVQIQVRKSKTFEGTIQKHIDEGVKTFSVRALKTVEKPSIIILVQYQNIYIFSK